MAKSRYHCITALRRKPLQNSIAATVTITGCVTMRRPTSHTDKRMPSSGRSPVSIVG